MKGDFGGNQMHLHYNKTFPAVRVLAMLEKSNTPAPLPLIYIGMPAQPLPVPMNSSLSVTEERAVLSLLMDIVLLLFCRESHLRSLYTACLFMMRMCCLAFNNTTIIGLD